MSSSAGALATSRETCPFCRSSFEPTTCANCSSGCPMGSSCTVLSCPCCGYRFPKPTGLSSLLSKLLTGRRARTTSRAPHEVTLAEARPGQRLRVTAFQAGSPDRLSKLAAFGIVEGCELRVRQRHPALVVEIGETALALDAAVARAVVIRPIADC